MNRVTTFNLRVEQVRQIEKLAEKRGYVRGDRLNVSKAGREVVEAGLKSIANKENKTVK